MHPQLNQSVNFELYKIFYHAASSLNFSKAAQSLHVTQSAVSQAIKSLENQLGVHLFFRQGRNVTLTFEGDVLLQHIEKAYHFIRAAENSINSIRSLDEGTVFIGASDTITRFFLMDSIKRFHTEYPRVKLSINNRPSPRSVEKLTSGEIDLAVINIMPGNTYDGLDLYPLTSLDHIFIGKEPLKDLSDTLSELCSHPLVCLEQNSTTRRVLDRFFESHDIKWSPAFEFGSFDVILEAVSAGMGIGFVPRRIAQSHLNAGAFHEVETALTCPTIDIGILINTSKPLSLATQKYLEILKNTEI